MRLSRRRDERGAAAVEFALVAVFVFIPLVIGILQFGIWFWAWQQSGHAAREAARVAAVAPTCSDSIRIAGEVALDGAPVTASNVAVGVAPTQVGDPITVTVTATTYDIGFFPFFDPAIQKDAVSRVENIPAGTPVCP
jgi:Flp pilus assembly protein TadG